MEQLVGDLNERLSSGWSAASDTQPLFQALEELGVDMLNMPALTTANGRQGRVSMLDLRTVVDARNVNGQLELQTQDVGIGPALDFIPTLSPDGSSVSLYVQTVITATPGRE